MAKFEHIDIAANYADAAILGGAIFLLGVIIGFAFYRIWEDKKDRMISDLTKSVPEECKVEVSCILDIRSGKLHSYEITDFFIKDEKDSYTSWVVQNLDYSLFKSNLFSS